MPNPTILTYCLTCKGLPLKQERNSNNFTCKYCRGPGSISRPSDYEKSVLTSCPERCAISSKSAMGICRNITPPNPFTRDKDFHPPYCKCCPSVRGSGSSFSSTCFKGPDLHRNVSIHIHIKSVRWL